MNSIICVRWKRRSGYYRAMLAENIRGTGTHRRNLNGTLSDWAALSLMMAFALVGIRLHGQTQALGQKQSTASGHVVTVYSISWPTPLSSVSADVEVCAGPNAPADSFAFPSFFQVHFADGGAIASYGSKKQPTLERTPLKPKQCARGWLDFAVTSGQKPTFIRYHEMSPEKKAIEWPVK